jgi:hypothetical protein
MNISRRLDRIQAMLPVETPEDPWYQLWLGFKEFAFAEPERGGFAEALGLVRQRVEGNERHVFPGHGPILREGHDVRLWVMCETVWTALRGFPDANRAVEDALQSSFEETMLPTS